MCRSAWLRSAWAEPWAWPPAGGAGGLQGACSRGTRAKRPFDNHLEGSSIKRYSEVAEAMRNLRYHPIEETGEATRRRD